MLNKQNAKMSKITLVGTEKSSKVPMKLTKTDRLAVATLSMYAIDDRTTDMATDMAEEMGESPLFTEFVRKYLSRIESAGDREGKEIELISCLATFDIAKHFDVIC